VSQSGFLDFYPFDPVGLNSEANATKEIKNGRLAMVGASSEMQHLSLVSFCGRTT
jgi:hypothetical protein